MGDTKFTSSGAGKFLCPGCLKRKLKSEFHQSNSPERHPAGFHCLECEPHRRLEKTRETLQQKDMAKKAANFAIITKQIRDKPLEVPHISELAEEVMKSFGSDELSPVKGFAKDFKSHFDAAMTGGKIGTKTMTDLFMSVTKMVVASTEHRDSAPDVTNLTDEQMEEALAGAAMRAIAANPKALIEMAEKMGLRVYDPNVLDVTAEAKVLIEAATAKTVSQAIEHDELAVAATEGQVADEVDEEIGEEPDAPDLSYADPLSDGDIDLDELYEDIEDVEIESSL